MSTQTEGSIWDDVIPAPEHLTLDDGAKEQAKIVWVDRLREYREAMDDLGRMTVVGYDPEVGHVWVGSVESSR